jgi:hypothetical protein
MIKMSLLIISLSVVAFSFTGCDGCNCRAKTPTPAESAEWQCSSLADDEEAYRECIQNALE